jgi:putative transposase
MARVHYRLFYHFVWSTWDREPLLVGQIEHEAYALIQSACKTHNAEVHALGGVANHVHLLVSLPRTLLIPDFMETVKGMSSKVLNDTHGSLTWSFKWQGGYGVDTVSLSHLKRLREYIGNQKQHHASNTLWTNCEPD